MTCRLYSCLLAASLSVACIANAAGRAPIIVRIEAPAGAAVDATAVRDAIERELRRPVVDGVPGPSARLTISLRRDGWLIMTFTDETGYAIARTVAAPTDPIAATELIALLAGNLARNEVGDLEAELVLAPPPAPAASVPPVPESASPVTPSIQPETIAAERPAPSVVRSAEVARRAAPGVNPYDAGRFALRLGGVGGASFSRTPVAAAMLTLSVRLRHASFDLQAGFSPDTGSGPAGFVNLPVMGRIAIGRVMLAAGIGPTALRNDAWWAGGSLNLLATVAIASTIDLYVSATGAVFKEVSRDGRLDGVVVAGAGLSVRFLR